MARGPSRRLCRRCGRLELPQLVELEQATLLKHVAVGKHCEHRDAIVTSTGRGRQSHGQGQVRRRRACTADGRMRGGANLSGPLPADSDLLGGSGRVGRARK
jgi:hypothetical protein